MKIQIVDDDELFVYEDDESKIFYRRIPDDVTRRLRKRHTKTKGRDRMGQRIEEIEFDDLANDIIDYVVVKWENVVHPRTGQEVPCTPENKAKLPTDVKNELMSLAQGGSGVLAEEKKIISGDSEDTLSS